MRNDYPESILIKNLLMMNEYICECDATRLMSCLIMHHIYTSILIKNIKFPQDHTMTFIHTQCAHTQRRSVSNFTSLYLINFLCGHIYHSKPCAPSANRLHSQTRTDKVTDSMHINPINSAQQITS